ncbi:MAG: hypothetical protein CMH62_02265 [Nanoarchaeota archaeon]|nr:hypothetical protein [Nanoarchaeota archaeon]
MEVVKMVGNLPIKKWRSGSIDGAIWSNKRQIERDGVVQEVEFKTVTLRRSWKDKGEDVWRDERLNLRKTDIPKLLVILNKMQDELLLTGDKNE